MIIFENEAAIESTTAYLNFRYGVNTQLSKEGFVDSLQSNTINIFNHNIVNIFNQAILKCENYSPFQTVYSNNPLFSENFTNYQPILDALFAHCILSSIETAKFLAFSFKQKQISKNISPSKTIREKYYIFKCSLETQLNHGYFFKKQHPYSNLTTIYDYDSAKWQSNRRTLKEMREKDFMSKIIAAYDINFSSYDNLNDDILIPSFNADFTSHLLLSPEILSTIKLIDKHISTLLDADINEETNTAQNTNNNSTDAVNNEQEELSYSITRSKESIFQEHIKLFSSYNPQNIFKNLLPIEVENLDFVDSLIFADQLESIFHANLYTYLFSREQRRYFYKYLKNFEKDKKFTGDTYKNSYSTFMSHAFQAAIMPTNRMTPIFIDYAIRTLENYHNRYDMSKYPNHLIRSDSIARFAPKTPINQQYAFHHWNAQFDKYIHILSELYLPILERTFFILLYEYMNTQGGNSIINIMNQLYDFINDNTGLFIRDNISYQKLYEKSEQTIYKKFAITDNEKKISTRSKKNEDHFDYITLPAMTESFIKQVYENTQISLFDGSRLTQVASRQYAQPRDPYDHSRPDMLDIIYSQHAGQIINYFSMPYITPTT